MTERSAENAEMAALLRKAPDPSGWRAGMVEDDYAAMAAWLTDQGVVVLPTHCGCSSLCSMGPTCPAASPDLAGAGCWRTKQQPSTPPGTPSPGGIQ